MTTDALPHARSVTAATGPPPAVSMGGPVGAAMAAMGAATGSTTAAVTGNAPLDNAHSGRRSMAHATITAKKVVHLSFDTKTGCEECGILEMSNELIRLDLNGTKPKFETATNIWRVSVTFNKCIYPGGGDGMRQETKLNSMG